MFKKIVFKGLILKDVKQWKYYLRFIEKIKITQFSKYEKNILMKGTIYQFKVQKMKPWTYNDT